jgi:hypothetical protein
MKSTLWNTCGLWAMTMKVNRIDLSSAFDFGFWIGLIGLATAGRLAICPTAGGRKPICYAGDFFPNNY